MKHDCGHEGCDFCGRRGCDGIGKMQKIGAYLVCDYCLLAAVDTMIRLASRWAVVIDTERPCGDAGRAAVVGRG